MAIKRIIKLDTKEAEKNMKGLQKEGRNLQLAFQKFALSVQTGVSAVKNFSDYSDKLISSTRILNTTFGSATKEVEKFVNSMSEMTGLDETSLINRTALFGQMATSLGVAGDNAIALSKNLTTVATKMSLLYNYDFNEMSQMLQNVMQGKSTTFGSKIGVVVNENTMQNTLSSLGLDLKANALNTAETAILRYLTVQKQLTSAEIDYEKVVNSVAWQKQMLTSQVERLKTALGNALYPVLQKLLPIFNAILMVLTELVNMLATFLGFDMDSINTSVENGSISWGSYADNMEKATKQLRSFDKLNNIKTPTSSSSGGGMGINQGLLDAMSKYDDQMLSVKNKATDIRNKIMEWLGFTQEIDPLTGDIVWKLKDGYTNFEKIRDILKILIKNLIGASIITIIAKIVNSLSNVWKGLKSILGLKPDTTFKQWIRTGFNPLNDSLKLTLSTSQKIIGVLGGLTMSVMGIMDISNAVKDMTENGINASNVLQAMLGTIGLITGAIVTMTVATGSFSVAMATATGGISLLLAGIVGLVTWLTTDKEKTDEVTEATEKYRAKMEELDIQIEETTGLVLGQTERANDLVGKLGELVDSNGKVTGSQEEVATILKNLNELLGTEYEITNGQITLNGKKKVTYDDLSKSVDNYCAKLRAEAYLEAYREKYNTAIIRQLDLKEQIKSKTQELIDKQSEYNLTTEEGVAQFISDNKDKIQEINNLKTELDGANKELDKWEKASYLVSVGRFAEAEELLTSTVSAEREAITTTIDDIISQSDRIPKEIKKDFSQIDGLKAWIEVNVDTSKAESNIKNFQNKYSGFEYKTARDIQFKAEGGFLNKGELFFARENGIPELVGTMGNRTAVANNLQIEKGIADASYQGMLRALKSAGGFNANVSIQAEGDTEGLLNFINFKQKENDRQFGF